MVCINFFINTQSTTTLGIHSASVRTTCLPMSPLSVPSLVDGAIDISYLHGQSDIATADNSKVNKLCDSIELDSSNSSVTTYFNKQISDTRFDDKSVVPESS